MAGIFRIGNAVFSRYVISQTERVDLPLQDDSAVGRAQKRHLLITYLPAENNRRWVIINLHLSAFDEGALIRRQQIEVVKDVMLGEYAAGNYVVLGGDWNMRLVETNWPHTSRTEDLFWIHDLPESFTPEGWRWGVDPASPTIRTNERPYREGENYTTIIDGFLVSPNVEIIDVNTTHLHFRYTDHNPVTTRVRAGDQE